MQYGAKVAGGPPALLDSEGWLENPILITATLQEMLNFGACSIQDLVWKLAGVAVDSVEMYMELEEQGGEQVLTLTVDGWVAPKNRILVEEVELPHWLLYGAPVKKKAVFPTKLDYIYKPKYAPVKSGHFFHDPESKSTISYHPKPPAEDSFNTEVSRILLS